MKKFYFAVLSVFVPLVVFAGPDDKKKPSSEEAKKTTEVKPEDDPVSPFTFSGYLDSYYIGNFNRPQSRSNTGVANARAFDITSGQFDSINVQ